LAFFFEVRFDMAARVPVDVDPAQAATSVGLPSRGQQVGFPAMPAVLITGASTGIGRACALRLAARGFHVFAGVRRSGDGDRLRSEAAPQRGGALDWVLLDVTDEASVADALDRVGERLGRSRLAGLVNNAGIAVGGPVEHLPLRFWREQFEVNVLGQVAVTQAAMPLLRQGAGRIVFISSNSGRVGTPMMGPYCASKFAVEGLAESLRAELHEWDLPVVVVEPGAIATPIWEKGRALADVLDTELDATAREQYGRWIELIRRAIDHQEGSGIPPDRVARVVELALTVDDPRHRYAVGIDAKISALAARFAPDRSRAALVRAMADQI
jgi:NAD(P)-dependent dehydrogenase (short-subunit alcohol dehydrogenase family)